MKLLHLDTSILGTPSVTRELSAMIVERIVKSDPTTQVTYRDLAADALPHFSVTTVPSAHFLAGPEAPSDDDGKRSRAQSDQVLQDFLDADTIVIGVPMYNWNIPSQLKAWFDRIVIPGTTFAPTKDGPVALAPNKRVIAAIARGGFYGKDSAMFSAEHAESYIRIVFNFLGCKDIEFVLAEGLSQGEASKAEAIKSAHEAVLQFAA
ncbi:FMN-dependent NADH-azoreductase [Rhizobium leguminosarum]|uniref:FMN-dependent NADH-azoreductase n=1 Tax=Rhizobium leguminosarum TaxID=384 RepID=UPI001C921BD0|nr:NAD(P)H-dependent oxidoreductase [Rhizobium leguminosarum]MBY2907681.1 FMN-dependent NADH-azoreductase [Rhizobium leguminosarum]